METGRLEPESTTRLPWRWVLYSRKRIDSILLLSAIHSITMEMDRGEMNANILLHDANRPGDESSVRDVIESVGGGIQAHSRANTRLGLKNISTIPGSRRAHSNCTSRPKRRGKKEIVFTDRSPESEQDTVRILSGHSHLRFPVVVAQGRKTDFVVAN